MTDDAFMPFYFEVPANRIRKLDDDTFARLAAWFGRLSEETPGGYCSTSQPQSRNVLVYEGRLPARYVTVLQALAMGHDVNAVMDLLGWKER